MERVLQPEILDSLSPGDPAALHNRRDLRIINVVMGNRRWLRRTLPTLSRPAGRVLEIGAGMGELGRVVAARVPRLDGLDLWPRPAGWPASSRWHQTDVFAFRGWSDYDVVMGNMIFHQFDAAGLRALGERIAAHARVIIACEPARRRRIQHIFAGLCVLIRANYVSRHDGHVSIQAGFLGNELPLLLGLDARHWRWRTEVTALGAYHLVAERRTA